MSGEAGDKPAEGGENPAGDPPEPGENTAEAPQEEGEQANAGAVEETAVKIDEVARKMSRKKSVVPSTSALGVQSIIDIDRTALEAILDVSSRLQDIQKKSKISMSTLALGHESYKDKQVNKVLN